MLFDVPGSTKTAAAAESKYRTLLDVSAAISTQSNFGAVLQSLRKLLSSVAAFEAISLLLLDNKPGHARLVAFDGSSLALDLGVGTEVTISGTAVGTSIDDQKPVLIPNLVPEMMKVPELANRVENAHPHLGYVFPLSVSRRSLGALIFTKASDFTNDDLELMKSVSSHVAASFGCAIASDEAENYLRQIAVDRDRFKLLLEINNHVVNKLDIIELFRAASASIRTYFANDFTGFWLLDKDARILECAALDSSKSDVNSLADSPISGISDDEFNRMQARHPRLFRGEEIASLPATLAPLLKADQITSLLVSPIATATGVLGVIATGSKRPHAFGQEDLDLLSQVSGQIALAVENAVAYGRLNASKDRVEEERLYLESEIRSEFNFDDIVGHSPSLRKVLDQIGIVAPTDSTVLLHGETGTGKELVARAIHRNSQRRSRTFVRLNCAAIPSGLIESEMFGHEKGAFTGALMQKHGRFELADKGTLFLDEIGDISLELQPKLLRALQEKEFERLGSTRTIRVDVRLIAATHRDLSEMISKNQFREDLFYRLNVFPIEIPPLRERREDIPLLVHYFVSRLAGRMRKQIRTIPKRAMDAMTLAPWPGNIRELENFIERCVILTQGEELTVPLTEIKRTVDRVSITKASSGGSTLLEAERQVILDALRSAAGKVAGPAGAAQRLGVKRTTLQNKMRRLNISKSEYQAQ